MELVVSAFLPGYKVWPFLICCILATFPYALGLAEATVACVSAALPERKNSERVTKSLDQRKSYFSGMVDKIFENHWVCTCKSRDVGQANYTSALYVPRAYVSPRGTKLSPTEVCYNFSLPCGRSGESPLTVAWTNKEYFSCWDWKGNSLRSNS